MKKIKCWCAFNHTPPRHDYQCPEYKDEDKQQYGIKHTPPTCSDTVLRGKKITRTFITSKLLIN